jgi:ABC-type multidrug transport system fused ATPase/permease subunit
VIPAYAEGVCPRCQQTRKVLWRLLDIAKPYRHRVWAALALTLVVSALTPVPPIFLRYLIDGAVDPQGTPGISRLISACSACSAGACDRRRRHRHAIVRRARLHMLTGLGTRIARDLRHKVYEHLHSLSLRFFAKRRTGSLITRVTNDTDRLWDFVVFGSVNLVRDVLMIVIAGGLMFYLTGGSRSPRSCRCRRWRF